MFQVQTKKNFNNEFLAKNTAHQEEAKSRVDQSEAAYDAKRAKFGPFRGLIPKSTAIIEKARNSAKHHHTPAFEERTDEMRKVAFKYISSGEPAP